MIKNLIGRLTNNNDNKLVQIKSLVDKINDLEPKFKKLSDEDILKYTTKWQKELQKEEINLDDLLPEAFALVREAAKRSEVSQRHRDVQLLAGIVLHQGKVAEQKTGEGKTLTATLPLYLNSLTGKGSHLVTPNDYLSKHGAGWYGSVYQKLGVSVGVIVHDESFIYDTEYYNKETLDEYSRHLRPVPRLEAYKCDITYGTNSEFGFDYLRDNMRTKAEDLVQSCPSGDYGVHNFAIVDEVDNILIDIARTPLIISSQKDMEPGDYYKYAQLANGLVKDTDYDLDEKQQTVTLTELGISKIERKLDVQNLYENNFDIVHQVENALKAKALFEKDKDYVVQDGKVTIVDQNTGRLLPGNRWGQGLHQSVEAKENLAIQPESQTIATISYQNYYRLYDKLAGMTGTAETESEEFFKMYSLDVVVIPTDKPIARLDKSDVVYKGTTIKFQEAAKDIAERHKKGQPVLIGTTSVEKSQMLSTFLKRMKIPHEILNAKQHEKEAQVIAQAGKKGAVTVATNMAGRGVDIILGGDPFDQKKYDEIIKLGGLYVMGTERHDSRRIDNQLRGRAGRQGDPGESRFYLSLQDDLLRIFGGERIESVMNRLGADENMPIEAGLITRAIENAQKKVEGMNFDRRRSIVQFDDVMNVQREIIYNMRRQLLFMKDLEEVKEWIKNQLVDFSDEKFWKEFENKENQYGEKVWADALRQITLNTIDVLWVDHIDTMDDLRSGVGLRGYGQVDPLVEYRREGKELFEKLQLEIWNTVVDRLQKVEIRAIQREAREESPVDTSDVSYKEGEFESGVAKEQESLSATGSDQQQRPLVKPKKVGRNEPCWCGSGKKFKHCHGKA